MLKKTKQQKLLNKIFFVIFFLMTIATLLISDKLIPWQIIFNSSYELKIPYRILVSFLYTAGFLVSSFLLAYYNKLKVIYLQIIAFIIGVTMTLFWMPLYKPTDKEPILIWTWYKYDIITVFAIYIFIFGLVKYLATFENINKLRAKYSKNNN